MQGYSEVVEVLLRNGADPNRTDRLGNTPLHLAACTNHIAVVTLLLRHVVNNYIKLVLAMLTKYFRAGTALTTLDNHGRTPLQLAQSKLKLLQRSSSQSDGMSRVSEHFCSLLGNKIKTLFYRVQVKAEVNSILEMMTEYLKRVKTDDTCSYEHLIQSFSQVSSH